MRCGAGRLSLPGRASPGAFASGDASARRPLPRTRECAGARMKDQFDVWRFRLPSSRTPSNRICSSTAAVM